MESGRDAVEAGGRSHNFVVVVERHCRSVWGYWCRNYWIRVSGVGLVAVIAELVEEVEVEVCFGVELEDLGENKT